MRRGEVYWFTFARPNKRRPVVVLTRSAILSTLERVTVAPITRNIRSIPSEVIVGQDEGLPEHCAVNLDNVSTVHRDRPTSLITSLSTATMSEIEVALSFALGFGEELD